jgi:hypothetical protein
VDPTTPGAEAASDLKGWRLAERHDDLLDFESIIIGCRLLWLRPSPELRGNRVRDGQMLLGSLPRWVAFKMRVDRDTSRN